MEEHRDIDQAAREWFVLRLEEAKGETLRGKVECTADSERRSFESGEELLAILRGVAGAEPADVVAGASGSAEPGNDCDRTPGAGRRERA